MDAGAVGVVEERSAVDGAGVCTKGVLGAKQENIVRGGRLNKKCAVF